MLPRTWLLTFLVLLSELAAASALEPPHRLSRTESLEKYDNPPMFIFRLETSPRMISQFGAFTSYQVNVDANGNNIVGDAANECSISVDPTNRNKMAIGWRQFNSVFSNFRQGGWGYTTDGGIHWTFPGVLQNNVFRSDPVTDSDETGHFLLPQPSSTDIFLRICTAQLTAANPGRSYQPTAGAGGGDKQWFTIDKTNGPGHGFQYQSRRRINCSGGGVQFQRSTDGGVTWQTPIIIPDAPVVRNARCGHQRQSLYRRRREPEQLFLRSLEQCADRRARHRV